ncbi:MAG: putative outer membrane protein-like protein [Gemmataceae bacterium]|nr:putative outer membrane protein-like protein [Gemmataceae bacterium]
MQSLTRAAAAACGLLLGTITLSADSKKSGKDVPFSDDVFVVKAASGGKYEVALGQIAKENASSEDVKKFGERMVTDHTKANKDLEEVAKKAGLGLPTTLLSHHQQHLEKFSKIKGAEFDKAYVKHMVKDHEEDVALFERASKEAKNSDLKDFAVKTLPTLKDHLKMAKSLDKGEKGTDK